MIDLKDKVIIRYNSWYYLVFTVIGALFLVLMGYNISHTMKRESIEMENNYALLPDFNFGLIMLFTFFVVLLVHTIICLYRLFDKRPKFIISKEGMWSHKYKHIDWDQIDYITRSISNVVVGKNWTS